MHEIIESKAFWQHLQKRRKDQVKMRGIQRLCQNCQQACKVLNAPNSTFECFIRVPKN